MQDGDKVLEIRELFQDLHDLEAHKEKYCREKKEARQLREEIARMKEERKAINLSGLRKEVEELETQYNALFKEIDLLTIKSTACLSISDLRSIFSSTKEQTVLVEKCTEFMERLATVCYPSKDELAQCVGDLCGDTPHSAALRLDLETETLLNLAYEHGLWEEISERFKGLLACKLGDACSPVDAIVLIKSTSILVIFPSEEAGAARDAPDQSAGDRPSCAGYSHAELKQLVSKYPKTGNVLCAILKDNMAKNMETMYWSFKQVVTNNEVFKGTGTYIADVNEWVLDAVMKSVLGLLRSAGADADHIVAGKDGVYTSAQCCLLQGNLVRFRAVESPRKAKAQSMLDKLVMRFFQQRTGIATLRGMLMLYSDITVHIKSYGEFGSLDQLEEEREQLFERITKESAQFALEMDSPVIMAKAKLKALYCDLCENIDLFVRPNTRSLFLTEFFAKLYSNILSLTLQPRKYTSREKEFVADVVRYALDLAYEHRGLHIDGYDKLESVHMILSSSLECAAGLYKKGSLCLAKSEVRCIIRMYFEATVERNAFLEELL